MLFMSESMCVCVNSSKIVSIKTGCYFPFASFSDLTVRGQAAKVTLKTLAKLSAAKCNIF